MILSIASQKGGTGKTSTAISLAAGLARLNRRVLLVDVDSQANSSKVLLRNYPELKKEQTVYQTIVERGEMPIHQTHVANLAIAPSHILLSNTDIELTTAKDHREARLKKELDKISHQYDHVIIDCPPALSWLDHQCVYGVRSRIGRRLPRLLRAGFDRADRQGPGGGQGVFQPPPESFRVFVHHERSHGQ